MWVVGGSDLGTLLDGVLLDLRSGRARRRRPQAFLSYAGTASCTRAPTSGVPAADATADLARLAHDRGVLAFVVDATAVHDRGASDAQELGWSLAAGATYLRTLSDAGLTVGGRPAWSSSGTPPPTSSSRPSRSCGRPAGSGRACSRSATRTPASSASTW